MIRKSALTGFHLNLWYWKISLHHAWKIPRAKFAKNVPEALLQSIRLSNAVFLCFRYLYYYLHDGAASVCKWHKFFHFFGINDLFLPQNSNSVSVDLLTYGDLESLRTQQHLRPGYGTQHIPGAKTRSQLHCKRYLIMTYTVEFDRLAAPLIIYYFSKFLA